MEIPDVILKAALENDLDPKTLALFILRNIDDLCAEDSANILKIMLDEE